MAIPLKVLIIEDSDSDAALNIRELEKAGYKIAHELVATAAEMKAALHTQTFNLIISDHNLPQFDSLKALALLKESGLDIPFLVVSGTIGEETAVKIMKAGAHDYVMKGNLSRLGSAVERELRDAEIRRQHKQAEKNLSQSYEKLKKTLESAIEAIAAIAEIRDPYTAGHQIRTTRLACFIAAEIGLSTEIISYIRMGATLHDIGKIYVPIEILMKPGKLSEIEFNMIKNHPQIGYDIVKKIDFPQVVSQMVIQHHERIDGSGYPGGLKGDNTTLEAKILAVSDVVEAMSSHRPYRAALGIDKALEEIAKNKGKLYAPDVVDACLKLFNEKDFKFEQ